MFAEIILPLPIYGTFTYSVPDEISSSVQIGSRVLVQFGKKKFYTGIVELIHSNSPQYEVKPISALLDNFPIVRYPQLKLWNWIAEYYLSSVGEVFKAAVPTGLKPESETFVSLNEDFEAPEGIKLSDREAMIVMLLEEKKKISISDIERELKFKNTTQIISRMLDMGVVCINEKIVEKYKARREAIVTLPIARGDDEALHSFFDLTRRSRQQEKALICYLDLSGWMHPSGPLQEVTRAQLMTVSKVSPGVIRALEEKGIFKIIKKSVNRFNLDTKSESNLFPLTDIQKECLESVVNEFNTHDTVLLHGVTGSGKTEIYTHLIQSAINDGNQVLYLVPEISLTTQLTDRLRQSLGDRLLVYHSKFSDSERVDIWKKLLTTNEPLVVLGARSSVFLPFAHLGLVIVDEEHEGSFKQYDPAPRYNARDTAMVLAQMHGAKVLLGSATPSVETYYKALSEKYGLSVLTERFEGASLPEVEIVNMPEQRKKKLNHGSISLPLLKNLRDAVAQNRQAIIFQNRRGFAPVVVCNQCGWSPKCQNCDVSMVYHKQSDVLKCHYCGFTAALPSVCPACGQNSIEIYGYGTERIAEELHALLPDAGISRMDLDTTRNKDSYQDLIEEFSKKETDILVGTQMVTKGLDFGDVTVSGVINADTLLNFPDFRSNERAFNMLEQVAGRAGRRKDKGKVIIQTSDPSNKVLDFVKLHDFKGFYEMEIKEREKYGYPPFTRIINVYLRNKDAATVDRAAVIYTKKLREIFGNRVLGPEKPYVSRVALWYIQSIMIKIEAGASMKKVKDILRQVYLSLAAWPDMKTTQIYYDVDPV